MRRVFIISDLHLGGRPDEHDDTGRLTRTGFQLCNAYEQLTDFIDWIRTSAKNADNELLELVINGDIVDFLAEDDFGWVGIGAEVWTADEKRIIAKLEHIVSRTRCKGTRGVFDALKDYVRAGNRLTFVLGNHDVELSLPLVRKYLDDLLGSGRGQFHFVYDGEAYSIGRLLIEHGNRYDPWNMINHSTLRQERSVRSRGLEIDEATRPERFFVAPAGTNLVIHFMNRIKSRYRFIDLLKPETNTVIPLLLALEPDRRPELKEIVGVLRIARSYLQHDLATPTMPLVPGDMANLGISLGNDVTLDDILKQTLGDEADLFADRSTTSISGDMGLRKALSATVELMASRLEQFTEMANSASAVYRLRRPAEDHERNQLLHAALRRLNRNDSTFNTSVEESTYLRAATETVQSDAFDVIVYGHTHLPKKIHLGDGRFGSKWYFNTGTWCDVMQLPDAFAKDYEESRQEVSEFIEAIQANEFGRYLKRYLSFVEVRIDVDGIVVGAELHSFCGRGKERAAPLTDWSISGTL